MFGAGIFAGLCASGQAAPASGGGSPTSIVANRFDLTVDASSGPAGVARTISIIPNGPWPSVPGKTITLTPSNGDAAITVAVPTSGSAAATASYTPSKTGEVSLAAANTAGLYNPYPAPLNVFASATGASQTIAAALTRSDMVTFQRDTASGNPRGFSLSWTKGWGEIWLNVSTISGATPGLFIRLYDARSSGATATPGSGTELTSGAVQVYGAISAAGTVRLLLPAGPYIYYADIATDAAWTNPIRIAQRFRVGIVIGHCSRSQESGLSRGYAYNSAQSLPTSYTKTATWVGYDYRYADVDSGWYLHDGSADPYQYHYSEPTSSGAQEIGRLIESQFGVCTGIVGTSASGGGFDAFVNHDGSFASGFDGTVSAAVGRKFRYLWMSMGGWDGVDGTNYPTETHAEVRARMLGAADWAARTYPACAIIGWSTGASGVFGSDGSRALGYTRNQMIAFNEMEPVNPMVVSRDTHAWNEFYSGHSTMGARVHYVRAGFRFLMAAEASVFGGTQSAARGPRLAATGTIASGSRTIRIPYTTATGTSLSAVGISFSTLRIPMIAAIDSDRSQPPVPIEASR